SRASPRSRSWAPTLPTRPVAKMPLGARSRGRSRMSQQVLVLNATYEPINVCSVQRAIVLVLKEKAEVLERGARRLRAVSRSYAWPIVIRLLSFVRVPRHEARKITRRAVFARDGYA